MVGRRTHARVNTKEERIVCLPDRPASEGKLAGRQTNPGESPAIIRCTTEDDREALRDFYCGLSKRFQELRLLSAARPDDAFVESIYNPPALAHQVSIVAIQRFGDHPQVVGYGRYAREADHHAIIDIAIRDDVLNYSIATQLLGRLASSAAQTGIRHLTAIPHATNTAMLKAFHQFGFLMKENADLGYIVVEKWVSPDETDR